MLKPIYTNYDLQLEILTPTHIGMGQEKNYLRGLDFIINKNKDDDGKTLYILRADKVMAEVAKSAKDLQTLTTKLSSGKYNDIEKLLISLEVLKNKNMLLRYEAAYSDTISEIKRQFSNGLGEYLIPGSSIKGAIRSVIYKQLKKNNPNEKDENKLFGKIDNNLMNLLTVSDVILPKECVIVYRTKVFSADGRPEKGEGMWKHERKGGHSNRFKESGFVSFYEGIKPKTKAKARIGIRSQIQNERLKQIPNQKLVFQKSLEDLFQMIREHTKVYLQREKEYFQKYKNDDIEETVFNKIDDLLKINSESKSSCVLRLGANVGFHSITGDWQFNNHISPWLPDKYSIKAKTRKFAFTKKADNSYDFHLMGFVKLSILS
ncbi:MAG: type III-A CRISPR-associated RAMP protein Csm5 [Runella sp.]